MTPYKKKKKELNWILDSILCVADKKRLEKQSHHNTIMKAEITIQPRNGLKRSIVKWLLPRAFMVAHGFTLDLICPLLINKSLQNTKYTRFQFASLLKMSKSGVCL